MGARHSRAVGNLDLWPSSRETLSVILPALNEEESVGAAIQSVTRDAAFSSKDEVIIVDGGSTDGTAAVAKKLGAKVLGSAKGRGRQMNKGAEQATGGMLLFLHADSQLPERYRQLVQESLEKRQSYTGKAAQWGCFQSIQLDVDSIGATILRKAVGLRTRFMHLPYGDQGIFVRASLFRQMGGYSEAPLMEDVDLVKQLCRLAGPPAIAQQPILTSARRWQRLGFMRTTLLNWSLVCAYHLGADPNQLAQWYYSMGRPGKAA